MKQTFLISDAKSRMHSVKRKTSFQWLNQWKCPFCGGQLWLVTRLLSLWGKTPPYFGGTVFIFTRVWLCGCTRCLELDRSASLGTWSLEPREEGFLLAGKTEACRRCPCLVLSPWKELDFGRRNNADHGDREPCRSSGRLWGLEAESFSSVLGRRTYSSLFFWEWYNPACKISCY